MVFNTAKEVRSTSIDRICTTAARHDCYKGITTLLFVTIYSNEWREHKEQVRKHNEQV